MLSAVEFSELIDATSSLFYCCRVLSLLAEHGGKVARCFRGEVPGCSVLRAPRGFASLAQDRLRLRELATR